MKGPAFPVAAFILVLLVASVPLAVAEEATAESPAEAAVHDPSRAIGYVYVYVLEWKPDLSGIGAGIFTYTDFDFSEFCGKVAEQIAGLFAASE